MPVAHGLVVSWSRNNWWVDARMGEALAPVVRRYNRIGYVPRAPLEMQKVQGIVVSSWSGGEVVTATKALFIIVVN